MWRKRIATLMTALALAAVVALPAIAEDEAAEARHVVEAARTTLAHFLADPDMTWVRSHLASAKSVLIIPSQAKGGLIIGGSGGVGVLLARGPHGRWSDPAFYHLGSVSVGLQAGGQVSEVLLFVQTEKGMNSFLSSSLKLGAGASVAAGPVGQGAQAATSDILSFSRTKGVFLGASLDGTVVEPAKELNKAFYGRDVSPVDILVRRDVTSRQADGLRRDLAAATRR